MDLHCCVPALPSCSERGESPTAVARLSERGLLLQSRGSGALGLQCCGSGFWSAGSVAVAHGLGALRRVESFWSRVWIHIPCLGRQILTHWTTRETQGLSFLGPDFALWVWLSYDWLILHVSVWCWKSQWLWHQTTMFQSGSLCIFVCWRPDYI